VKRAEVIGIVGAGQFGTALASVLARAGKQVVLWSRDTAVVSSINTKRVCPRLPGAQLPAPLEATADPKRLASEARFVVMAVTSTDVRERAREFGGYLDGSHIVVHAIGALATPTNERVSEVMQLGLPTLKIGVLAGPALPQDLAEGTFSSMVVASAFDEVVAEARRLLNAPPALRLYGSKDLAGVELASALSGAYTVALGLCDGLGMGAGPRAVLITRACAEAARLVVAAGGQAKTFAGLAGLGNLLVRASDRSADYQLGRRIADGVMTADSARTEGARAALAGAGLAKQLKARMPVLAGVAAVLAGKAEPRDVASLIGDSVATEE
jgi:glycerol-3-phosphate dehydrogenase (NAD(P)+)